jgi:hypothetical protein
MQALLLIFLNLLFKWYFLLCFWTLLWTFLRTFLLFYALFPRFQRSNLCLAFIMKGDQLNFFSNRIKLIWCFIKFFWYGFFIFCFGFLFVNGCLFRLLHVFLYFFNHKRKNRDKISRFEGWDLRNLISFV